MSNPQIAKDYYDRGLYKEAIEAWEKVLATTTTEDRDVRWDAYLSSSLAYWNMGNFLAVAVNATNASKINPDNYYPYYIRASAFKAMKRYDEAKPDYWRALEKAGDNPYIHVGLAEVIAESEGEGNAYKHFSDAFRYAEGNKEAQKYIWDTIRRTGIPWD